MCSETFDPQALSCASIIDALTRSNQSFALYRLPQGTVRLIIQRDGGFERAEGIPDLNERRGFVLAPFRVSADTPVLMIRPDIVAEGWETIAVQLAQINLCTLGPETSRPTILPGPQTLRRQYDRAFQRFADAVREGHFRKLVLSQSHPTPTERLSPFAAFLSSTELYPAMMVALVHTPISGTWLGSSPEILLSGQGTLWQTVALAGTLGAGVDDEPKWDVKNIEEQALVADYIRSRIARVGQIVREHGPYNARAGELVHLKTDFLFQLHPRGDAADLLQALHPTPAVCGLPKEDALQFIRANEGYDRRYYSGFWGWWDPDHAADVYVNLRCMEIMNGQAITYAGGGIMPASRNDLEWQEVTEKMRTMQAVLNPHQSATENPDLTSGNGERMTSPKVAHG